jgi:CDP-diacylglycerol--glycerol-3-phosphate 3-phosphatidyltransferase
MTMAELKLINKHWITGYDTVIEPIAKLLINLRVHPHVVTFTGLLLSILAFNFFRQGAFFFGGVMVVLAGTCDRLDGRLARDTNRNSKFGALIDSTIDRYSEVIVFLGLAIFFHDKYGYIVYLIILTIAGSLMVSYTRARAEGLGMECKVGLMQRPERITYLAIGTLLGSIPRIGTVIVIVTLWFIAILANVTVIQRVIHIRNQIKKQEGV